METIKKTHYEIIIKSATETNAFIFADEQKANERYADATDELERIQKMLGVQLGIKIILTKVITEIQEDYIYTEAF